MALLNADGWHGAPTLPNVNKNIRAEACLATDATRITVGVSIAALYEHLPSP